MSAYKEYDINKVYIGNIILQLVDFKITGWIELQINEQIVKKVYLKEGDFIYANSTEKNDKIGMILVNMKKITFQQLIKALEYQQSHKKMLGSILIELSYIKITDLELALYQQAKQIIMSMFQYAGGLARCYYGDIPKEMIPLKLDTEQIIIDSIKKLDDIEILGRALGDLDLTLELNVVPQKIQKLNLDNNDLVFLKRLSSKKINIREICEICEKPKVDIYKLLYLLMAIGCLKVANTTP